jgi:hypothetical protein
VFLANAERFLTRVGKDICSLDRFKLTEMASNRNVDASSDLWIESHHFEPVIIEWFAFGSVRQLFHRCIELAVKQAAFPELGTLRGLAGQTTRLI